jgi:hypothetical protein
MTSSRINHLDEETGATLLQPITINHSDLETMSQFLSRYQTLFLTIKLTVFLAATLTQDFPITTEAMSVKNFEL